MEVIELITKVNYFDDLKKIGIFIKSTADVTSTIHTLHIWISKKIS